MKPDEIERPLTEGEEQFLRTCFSTRQWAWASSMKGIPHEYIVRSRCRLRHETFDRIVVLQRECGIHEKWGNYNFPYVSIDGYKYWTMGADVEETIIINRQRIFNMYDSIADTYDEKMDCESRKDIVSRVSDYIWNVLPQSHHVLDIGCGTGLFLDMFDAPPELYVGVDPSGKMLQQLTTKHQGYARSVCKKAFEEMVKPSRYSLTVGLFGSPSYIMKQYAPQIRLRSKRYFLMYYPPMGNNLVYERLQQYFFPLTYTQDELRRLFPGAFVELVDGFLIVTNFDDKGVIYETATMAENASECSETS